MNNQQLSNYPSVNNIAYNPYSAINPHNLSDAALCYQGNPIQDCVHFTPNSRIQQMPSGVFHGQNGTGVRFIHSAMPSGSRTLVRNHVGDIIALASLGVGKSSMPSQPASFAPGNQSAGASLRLPTSNLAERRPQKEDRL